MVEASRHDEFIRIGELADRTGISPRLLRHYENHGVLSAQRSPSGQRLFEPNAVARVRHIRELLNAGLPIRVIKELIDCIHEPGRLEPCAVPLLVEHLESHDRRIAALERTRSALQGLIDASR